MNRITWEMEKKSLHLISKNTSLNKVAILLLVKIWLCVYTEVNIKKMGDKFLLNSAIL